MGYTHYYTQNRDLTPEEWQELTATFAHMLDHLPGHSTSAGGDYANEPLLIESEVNGRSLIFNGQGQLGHETFYLDREGHGSHFCKTARKPYDLLVCAVLLAVSEIAPGALTVKSDGEMDGAEWQPAREFLRNLSLLSPEVTNPSAVTDPIQLLEATP